MGLGLLVEDLLLAVDLDLDALLEGLLGIVPSAAGVVLEDGPEHATDGDAGHVGSKGLGAHDQTDDDRSDDRDDAGSEHLAQGGLGGDLHALAVLGLAGALEDPGDLAELAAHFVHHVHGSLADAVHRKGGEDNRDHAADEEGGKHLGVEDVDAVDPREGDVGGEEGERGECGRCDGEALADGGGGVADAVEDVGLFTDLLGEFAHLGDTAGVVGDRPEGVDGQLHGGGRHHGGGGDADAVEAGEGVGTPDGSREDEDRISRREHPGTKAGDDVGGTAGGGLLDDSGDGLAVETGKVLGDVGDQVTDRHADADRPEDVQRGGGHVAEGTRVEDAHLDGGGQHELDEEERGGQREEHGEVVTPVERALDGVRVGG